MNGSVEIIDLDASSEEFVSVLGGKKNSVVPMEVINVDVENDEIDDVVYRVSDFDIRYGFTGTTILYKNRVSIATIRDGLVNVNVTQAELNTVLDDMLNCYNRRDKIDWTFNDCDLDLLKEVYYQFRMLLFLYDYVRNNDDLAELVCSHKAYTDFFVYVHGFESGNYLSGDFCTIEFDDQKSYVRSKVPKFCKRYQTGKRKGQAYWKYGWNMLMFISCDIAVSPIASNGKRFMLSWGGNFIDHALIFTFNKLIIERVDKMSDPQSKWYFPLWCRIRLTANWSVGSKLDKLHFQDAKVMFIGPLQSFQGGSSEEVIV